MTWHSQAGQDEWVHSIVGDTGYFVDCGAHDGIVHSNTYVFEQLGWTGLCIEPNREAYETLRRNRTCITTAFVATAEPGAIVFDGVRVAQSGDLLAGAPLWFLLEEAEAPPTIDYLSIDVEGHELQVLAGMDFDRWHVNLITIEHNLYLDGPDRKNAIYDVLTGHGFERVVEDVVAPGYGPFEDFYEHRTSRHDPRPGSPA